MKIFKFHTRDAMVSALVDKYKTAFRRTIELEETISWAVSGGSTPKPLFESMSNADIEWSKVSVALVDERWVPIDHDRSNTAFVHDSLLQNRASRATFIPIRDDENATVCSADYANENYTKLKRPFDSILLGLGPDGHTASLFPDADGLEEAFDMDNSAPCAAITAKKSDVTGDEVDRITLTAAEIMRAHQIVLMITGDEKFSVVQQAMDAECNFPIGRLMRMIPEKFEIYWSP